jgi:type 1 glutamine amidotransferase
MRNTSIKLVSLVSLASLIAAACGTTGPSIDELNAGGRAVVTGGSSGTGGASATGGTGGASATGGTGGSSATGGTGGSSATGGTGGTAGVATGGTGALGGTGAGATGGTAGVATGGTAGLATGGTAGAPPIGGTGGSDPVGGSAGTGMETGGGAGMTGGSGGAPPGAYTPRTGSFKMLVYSQVCCGAFPHDSRPAGQKMLQAIGQKQGFEVTLANNESEINPEGLAKYEIVFFLNSTGDLWTSGNLRRDFETWIRNNGAYAGMHGATDSANSWAFYKELTGQYYDQHDAGVVSGTIQWTEAGLAHVTGKNLPNPWNRQEEWYKFNSWQNWSAKPGFIVLNTVTTTSGGTRPVSYVREWENIRAFYTSLGHADAPYTDETVIKHVTAGIMWAVRRQDLIVP